MKDRLVSSGFNVAILQYCAKGYPQDTLPIIERLICEAAKAGADFICLPECANFIAPDKAGMLAAVEHENNSPSLRLLCDLARQYKLIISAGSLLMHADNHKENRAVNRHYLIAADGQIIARYDKIHMFDADLGDGQTYRESDWFCAGNRLVICQSARAKIGLSICYDIRFANLYRQLAQKGAELILAPAAFTQVTGAAHWHVLMRARAIETGCFILAAAQHGIHADGRHTYGHSLIVNPWGEVLGDAGMIDEGFIIANIDLAEVQIARTKLHNLHHNPEYY